MKNLLINKNFFSFNLKKKFFYMSMEVQNSSVINVESENNQDNSENDLSENVEIIKKELEDNQKELEIMKDREIKLIIEKLQIDENYIELIEVDKKQPIETIEKSINEWIKKYPKFKKNAPITGGVVKNIKNVQIKQDKKNDFEPIQYDGVTPTSLKLKLKEVGN